ncbi:MULTISPECIES: ferredoxin family protein [unclassified Thermotoga]|uniref:ferredoxin family protein n=1 Tax=unclassified Thermotoga TaxID=2631113 RepID=UPI000280EA25|nr:MULTISPECIES: ferredoxin family protein [unclassified Thermotoga]AIY86733.1 ferredoxin-like protein FixX [Thermotoga sp. 2812B]EJX25451.1 ferredoxin-like protein FixX [Thermotoga sp. EMP]KAF2960562.1 4Fe-4S ferredoxin [Thermotoga sp. 38H-to]
MRIEDKLYLNRYRTDEENPHLKIKDESICAERCSDRPCVSCCPADVYEWTESGMEVKFEGCLECGTCRIVCPFGNIEWKYPRGNYGVLYKFG